MNTDFDEDVPGISVDEALDRSDMTLEDCVFDSVVPACCDAGCMVEPDGHCPHGHQSVLLKVNIL